jgi:hypothetical protein
MALTRLTLARRALEKLMVVGTGQTADDEDVEHVDGRFDAMTADLEAREVLAVPDQDDIDPAVYEWLADIMADTVAPDFGVSSDGSRRTRAEQMLKKIGAAQATSEPQYTEYF